MLVICQIENELRKQSLMIEIEQAASTLTELNNRLVVNQKFIETSKKTFSTSWSERIEKQIDLEVQLILKTGQVEMLQAQGNVHNDSLNSIVVPKFEIDQVNNAVQEAGQEKIRIIETWIQFKRNILVEEWHGEWFKQSIRHLMDEMHFVTTTPVTRDMRIYLERMAKGLKDDKSVYKAEKHVDVTRKIEEKVNRMIQLNMNLTQSKS